MFIAALFTIARTWKLPKCPSTDGWIKKMWHMYTMEYCSAMKRNEVELFVVSWMDLESATQSEVGLFLSGAYARRLRLHWMQRVVHRTSSWGRGQSLRRWLGSMQEEAGLWGVSGPAQSLVPGVAWARAAEPGASCRAWRIRLPFFFFTFFLFYLFF